MKLKQGLPARNFVLWGKHTAHAQGQRAFKISAGTCRQCLKACDMRKGEGWTGLQILVEGEPYIIAAV